jgi:hypothetical protein
LISATFLGCKKEKNITPINETYNASTSTLLAQGTFMTNVHATSGTAKLYTEGAKKILVFENFKTDNGPDLRVYLSKATNNRDFKELGVLKSTTGNFSYDVDTTINTNDYKYVIIWCEDFSVLFGNSLLQ